MGRAVSLPLNAPTGRVASGSGFGRNSQGVDVGGHEITESLVHQAVPGNQAQALKAGRRDSHMEVAPAIACTFMPCVQVTFISDFEQGGGQ